MVQVRVSEGILEGEVIQNEYGGSFCSFKGIPYAVPPIGDLRFKAPQPPSPWEGIRSAKEFGPQCFQSDFILKTGIKGSEDCLYLNVYTPNTTPTKPLPVMVWIHGGAFISGNGNDDLYGPEFLVRHDVVLVTLNYRLEVLGFLCLETEDVPGNAGMKDQVQALRWVKKNISNFGGDPDNVSIFGESAGGASVSFHLLSPMSKGLFKRAIAQSGAAACDWANAFKPRERAFALGRKLGFNTEDVKELYEFLKKQPVEKLVQVYVPILLSEKASEMEIVFNVVDEKQFGSQERFLYGNVIDNLKRGIHEGVDVMTGYTADEGIIALGSPETLDKNIDLARNFLEFFVPKPLSLILSANQQLEIGETIKNFYFKKETLTPGHWEQLVTFYSMTMFVYWIRESVKAYRQRNKVYMYRFSCKSDRNILAVAQGAGDIIKDKPVTSHGDDLVYLFDAKIALSKVDIESKAYELIDRVTTLWTNFAKYGNPTPDSSLGVKWTPYTVDNQEYLEIGNELTTGVNPNGGEIQFWGEIYRKYAPDYVL